MSLFTKLFGRREEPANRGERPAGHRILIADPSLTVTKVIELTLDSCAVTAAGSLAEATRALPDVRPHLALVSVTLPDGDGYELCTSIANDRFHSCPVILLHGTFETVDRDRAAAAGAGSVLAKPFEPARLRETVERLIAESDAKR